MALPKRKNELTACYLEDIKNKYNLTDAEEEAIDEAIYVLKLAIQLVKAGEAE